MSIPNLIAISIAVLLLWSAYYLFWLCMTSTDNLPEFVKWVNKTLPPKKMHENTKMNKVGCCLCSILLFVALVPLMILYGIYLLFHIGRKDEKKWQRILIIEDISSVKIEETDTQKYGKDLNMLNESSVFLKDASRVRNRR